MKLCIFSGSHLTYSFRFLGYDVRWTNLNPRHLIETLRGYGVIPVDYIEDLLNRVSMINIMKTRDTIEFSKM